MTPAEASPGRTHHFAVVNGIRMHYVAAGHGPLVILLHGFPEFWYSWRRQLAALAPHFRVVAPDQRGYNLTAKPRGVSAYAVEHLVADVAALIQHLGEERAIIIGHDWGGGVAWSFAMTHPEMTQRLVVMNCPHPTALRRGLRRPRQLLRSWYVAFFQLPWLPELAFRAGNYRAIGHAFRAGVHRRGAFTRGDVRAYKEAARQPGALTAAINWYRAAVRGFRQTPLLTPVINISTLLIWGEDDFALGKELTEGMEAWVTNLTVRYLPNTGHWVQQEQPELVNRYLLEFLADLVERPRA